MLGEWRRRHLAARVRSGDGRALKPYRWWQPLSRSLFYLSLDCGAGPATVYAVEVRRGGNSVGEVTAELYRDGRQHASSKLPAAFPVEGGTIEVAASSLGLKRCHYVTAGGAERALVPDPRSAEGRRARLERAHPALSRAVAFCSMALLVVGLGLLLLQTAGYISQIPPIAEGIGVFVSPVSLPAWLNTLLGVGATAAGMERALRLRYHWLLDGAAG